MNKEIKKLLAELGQLENDLIELHKPKLIKGVKMGTLSVNNNVYDTLLHKKGIVKSISDDGSLYPVEVRYDCATVWYSLDGKTDVTKSKSLYKAAECDFTSTGEFVRIAPETANDWYAADFPDSNQTNWGLGGGINSNYWDAYDKPRVRQCNCSTQTLMHSGCGCGAFKREQKH